MPDAIAAALAIPGAGWLAAITLLAGVVYGFAGFGSALIFVPLASAFVPVEQTILCMGLFGLSSVVTVLPRAWRTAERAQSLTMLCAALICLPVGGWVLRSLPETPLRWGISAVVGLTLAALIAGWRYRGRVTRAALIAVGGLSGVIGGATGLTGPAVILFQLSSPRGAEQTRANTIVFLTLLGTALVPNLWLQGVVTPAALVLAGLLTPVYMIGTRTGQWAFDPARQGLYRVVAYGIIGASVLAGLPVWG